MLNLLQNAVKFTDEGSITLDVQQIVEPVSQIPYLKVLVEDTGIGIAAEDQAKLFERFSQVDSSLTRKVGGTGLGLSITKHLVEMQGGEIHVESVVDKGSSFWFTLPIAVEEEIELPEDEEEILPGAKIIVSIDDDVNVIDLYKRYLRTHGFQVIAITNPTNIVEEIKNINPYAITLDIMMPSKDGWQVIEEIKSDPQTAHIPVIICSIVEDRDRAYQLGAVDYLVKPILEDEMVDALKRLKLSADRDFNEILVIDDDPNVFQLIEIALQNEAGYQLKYANGGFAGLEILKDSQPSAIILDLMMPDLDGFSILETMQGDPMLRNIPVIILTAADLTAEQREQIAKSKREVLKKDVFRGDQLISILENALESLIAQEKE
jgi:CheY-like chemotaxis protein